MSNEMIVSNNAIVHSGGQAVDELAEMQRIAKVFVASGLFSDVKDVAQALIKMLAGKEFGLSPVVSMQGVHIVNGRPTISSNLMATIIARQGYKHVVQTLTDTECVIKFFGIGGELGVSSFTIKDAEKAGVLGKDIWRKYPRNMLFARAMSNGCRWFCAPAFGGQAPYTPDELGEPVDETGNLYKKTKSARSAASRLEERLIAQEEPLSVKNEEGE